MIKGVIFDFWGTLVENGIFPSPVRQVRYILRLRMHFKDYILRFEKSFMTHEYKDLNEAFTAVCKEFELEPRDFIIEELVGMWNKNELLGKPFLETTEILDYLKDKKIKIGLISNTTSTITRVLDKFDFNKYFEATMFSYDTGFLKTDPEMFDKILKKMKLKKEEVVMIGDSIPTDVLGARNAGVKSILLDRRNQRDFVPKIVNLREIKDLIEKNKLEEFASQEIVQPERREEEQK